MVDPRYSGIYLPEEKRISGHVVTVFSMLNVELIPCPKDEVVPVGKLNFLFSVDIGEIIATQLAKRRDLPEGVLGSFYILPGVLQEAEKYIDLTLEHRRGDIRYDFDIRKDCASAEEPLEFLVGRYEAEEEILDELWQDRVQMHMQKKSGDFSLHYFRKKIRLDRDFY